MRIGIVSSLGITLDAFFPDIVDNIIKLGHEVVTASGTASSVGPHTEIKGLTRRPNISNINVPNEIKTWVKEQDIDLVVVNTATASGLVRLRHLGVPVVYFCHGLHWNLGSKPSEKFWQWFERQLIRRTAGIICINSNDETWFGRYAEATPRIRLMAGVGVPLATYPVVPMPDPVPLRLLWAGEFSDRKRPSMAVQLMENLVGSGLPVHLTMIGTGELEKTIRAKVETADLGSHIQLLGHTNFADAMSSAHALLHTATWEGLPRVGLEAAAMGRRTFAFDVKGVRDLPEVALATDGDLGMLQELIREASLGVQPVAVSESIRQSLDTRLVAEQIVDFLGTVLDNSSEDLRLG